MAQKTRDRSPITLDDIHHTQVMRRVHDGGRTATVRVVAGPDTLKFTELHAGERIVVGREPTCDLTISDASVSRQHAAFAAAPDGVTITLEDLGSTNGTHIDGAPITGTAPLPPGGLVRLGGVSLRVEFLSQPEIKELHRVERELHSAGTDPLTGLRTRRVIEEEAARAVTRLHSRGAPISAVFLDIDRFKGINDTYGHAIGDSVLRTVARLTREAVRAEDIAIRFGGEEFLVILLNCGREDARRLAERIRERVLAWNWALVTPMHAPKPLEVSVSLGVSTYDGDFDQWIERADKATYRSKTNGRNQVTVA